jgi:hypothetical protein
MKQPLIVHKFFTVFLIVICSMTSSSFTIAQTTQIEKRAIEYYKPDTWPKSTQFSTMGFTLDDFSIPGFNLKEKRYFAQTRGISYIWYNEEEQLELGIVINVYASVEAGHDGMLNWLATGTSARMEKGTLTAETELIGDISWADPAYFTLAFARNNVVILMFGRTKKESHRQIIDDIAVFIDNRIRSESKRMTSYENITSVKPIIENVSIEDSELRVNQKTKLTVVAHDPREETLRYGYYAEGGNILNTNEGVFYQATVPGRHEILVTVINEQNIRSEEGVSVTVLDY